MTAHTDFVASVESLRTSWRSIRSTGATSLHAGIEAVITALDAAVVLLAGDLDGNARIEVSKNSGAVVGTRRRLNLIEGSNVTLTVTDDSGNEEVDITIASTGGGGGAPVGAQYVVMATDATLTDERALAVGAGIVKVDGGAGTAVTLDRAALVGGDVEAGTGSNVLNIALNAVDDTKLRNSAALSVIGRAANSTGDPADIAAGADGDVLRRSGTTLGFGTISESSVTGLVADLAAKAPVGAQYVTLATDATLTAERTLAVGAGLSLVDGGAGAAVTLDRSALTGDVTAAAGSNATTVAANAVGDTKLRDSVGVSVIGRSANSTGDPADIVAGADGDVLRRASGVVGFGAIPESSVTSLVSDLAAKVPTTRTVSTASPLTGGGALSGDLTLDLDEAVALGNNARVTVRKNTGADVGTRRRINLIEGTNITLTVTDDAGSEEVDVTIAAAAGGSAVATTVEKDLGATPTWTGVFTITDAAITSTSKVLVTQAPGPYTGKGTRADEAEMDAVDFLATPATGSASVRWRVRCGFGRMAVETQGNTARSGILADPKQDNPGIRLPAMACGRVKGNFKVTYQVFA